MRLSRLRVVSAAVIPLVFLAACGSGKTDASAANARRNRLVRRIRAREGSAPSGEGPFDVVLANLIASLLVTLADGLVADLRPGGTLLASGIFVNREAEVIAAFESRGLVIADRWSEGEWIALEVRRPA